MTCVGFTGTATGLTPVQDKRLTVLVKVLNADHHHHGDCIGADANFHSIARAAFPDQCIEIHPPVNAKSRAYLGAGEYTILHVPRPYLQRNHDIVDLTDVLVACPSGMAEQQRSGTWATVRYARKVGKPIMFVWPDGTMTTEQA